MFDHTLQTHYEVLGIGPYADIFEIKSAYKARALKPHPNKNGGTPKAKKAFQHLVNAYDVLSDVTKRKLYDQTLPRAYFSQSWFSHIKGDESTFFGASIWPTQPPPSSNSADPPNPFEPFADDKSAPWRKRYEDEKRTYEEMEEQANERSRERERMKKEAEELWVMGGWYTMYPEHGSRGRTSRSCGRGIGRMA